MGRSLKRNEEVSCVLNVVKYNTVIQYNYVSIVSERTVLVNKIGQTPFKIQNKFKITTHAYLHSYHETDDTNDTKLQYDTIPYCIADTF